MLVLNYTKKKLRSLINLVQTLEESDYPHSHAKLALEEIRSKLEDNITTLVSLPKKNTHPDSIKALCAAALDQIVWQIEILGFITRSSENRNAFELHGPFIRLVHKALDVDAKLIIFSEWAFSPFTYINKKDLNNFVFIGLPASEISNSLAIPLAGHELGHNIWTAYPVEFSLKYQVNVENTLLKHILNDWSNYQNYFPGIKNQAQLNEPEGRSTWGDAYKFALAQCEELFCDFIGIVLFKESYLYAFAYLIAPGAFPRHPAYPSMIDRTNAMVNAAKKCSLKIPANYSDQFTNSNAPFSGAFQYLLSLSDHVSADLVDDLIDDAKNFIASKGLDDYSQKETKRISQSFAGSYPAENSISLSNIINASWDLYLSIQTQGAGNHTDAEEAERVLNEVTLKTLEVFEIELLQGQN